jgi:HSP20 family protein
MPEPFGPMLEVARIQSEINRLFENLLHLSEDDGGASGDWIPHADIVEGDEALVVRMELAGVDPDDLEVVVNSGNLIVRGTKRQTVSAAEQAAEDHVRERRWGPFRRVIQLGIPVNTRLAKAELDDGLLSIMFPKVPNRRGEDVPIEVVTR